MLLMTKEGSIVTMILTMLSKPKNNKVKRRLEKEACQLKLRNSRDLVGLPLGLSESQPVNKRNTETKHSAGKKASTIRLNKTQLHDNPKCYGSSR